MNFWPVAIVFCASSIAMLAGWLMQLRTRNAGIVDPIWAVCMSASALFYASTGSGALVPRLAVAMLGGFWGFRLCMHLLSRVLSEQEDGRYRYLREYWNDSQIKFFTFFQGQALLTALFSLPFYSVAQSPIPGPTPWCLVGLAIWILSITGETIADMQLARFRKDQRNRGKTCRSGLWRYSRHPNYFFEWLHWFSYVFLAHGAPFWTWWLSLLGPVMMGVSLVWVTGIPFVEAQAVRARGEDYRRYQRETSVFVPWFPRPEA
jgi:steroid 5-alpha reductase family enzyme